MELLLSISFRARLREAKLIKVSKFRKYVDMKFLYAIFYWTTILSNIVSRCRQI
jgi:hypothetical protein